MNRHRTASVVLVVVALVTAGCLGGRGGAPAGTPGSGSGTPAATPGTEPGTPTTAPSTPEGTPTVTPLPPGSVDFPDGPKERPERPATLNASSVREYVRAYEYRLAYNSLWTNEYTDVTLACRVDDASERQWGYEAVVTCTGHSETNVPENSTARPAPHADWFTRSFRYRVSADATHRDEVDPREPVS